MIFRYSKLIGVLATMMLVISSCASVFEGKAQQIFVNTNPPGAECGIYRELGARIGTIESTPAQVLIEKSKNDIFIVCVKRGYQQAMVRDHSGVAGAAFANIIGGVFTLGISTAIGVAVDSSNGSDNKYESPINISMVPNVPGEPEGPTVLPRAFDLTHSESGDPPQASVPAVASGPAAERSPNRQKHGQASSGASSAPTPAGPSFGAGTWICAMNNIGNTSNPRYTLQFVVSEDKSIVVTSYADAPATIVESNPLTFTAINPRGSRQMRIVWKPDNSMIITGPNLNKPGTFFYNDGSCLKT